MGQVGVVVTTLLTLPPGFSWIRARRLAIGGFPHATEAWQTLQAMGVASVFSCCGCDEGLWQPPPGLHAVQLQLPDHRNQLPLTAALFDQAVDQALVLLERHPALYVHCWAGLERSPLLAVALLCRSEGLDLFTALEQVRRAHPQAQPLPGHLELLERWLAIKPGPHATP